MDCIISFSNWNKLKRMNWNESKRIDMNWYDFWNYQILKFYIWKFAFDMKSNTACLRASRNFMNLQI